MTFDEMMVVSKEVSLILFFILFLGVIGWAYWPGHRTRFENEGKKILEEEDNN
ncbi:MAG: cbb3-type cytochrome c oxidase subunit 3 [Magnetococcales bacterium]|nr:cbb3-type cytochrome c oxidase subunit 3 [Magnetococcales bacterium]